MERYHLQLSRLQRGRNPSQGTTAMDATSRLLANPSSPTEPQPRLRNGHPNAQGVQVQHPNMSFAITDCFGPHNINKRILVKKGVKRYRSNNLKNDCESKEINSQDSEHYLQPHFMDGYIKRDDYLYINTGYLQI